MEPSALFLLLFFYMSPEIFLNMYVLQGVLSPAVNAKMPALWWRLPEMKIMAGSISFRRKQRFMIFSGKRGSVMLLDLRKLILPGFFTQGDRIICNRIRHRIILGDVAAPVRLAFGMPVDLNKATLEELILIPGIGPYTASKIIKSQRGEWGIFNS